MAYDVIKKAAAQYLGKNPEDFEDEIIVCECARVSLGTLKEIIRINNLKTIEEITEYTKAGAFCKSCIRPGGHEEREHYLVDILREVRAEMENELQNKTDLNSKDNSEFANMTIVQKIKAIESVIDEKIRPMLMMDGGNMEIIDLKMQAMAILMCILDI